MIKAPVDQRKALFCKYKPLSTACKETCVKLLKEGKLFV